MMRIHYWELSNYNNGTLIGQWFDLDNKSEEDHSKELTDWVESVKPINPGYPCEEWIVGDYEDIPQEYVSEWSIDPDFFEYMEALDSSHLDAEVFQAGVSLGIPFESIEEAYHGQYDSNTELAEEYIESTGMLDGVNSNISMYFDYEAYGRDLAMDFIEEDGHYFYNNY